MLMKKIKQDRDYRVTKRRTFRSAIQDGPLEQILKEKKESMQRFGGKGLLGSIQGVGNGLGYFTEQQAGQYGWSSGG